MFKKSSKKPVYFCTQMMSGAEKQWVKRVLDTDWVTTIGPDQTGFERDFEKKLEYGVKCLALNSGTAALELAYRVLGIGVGDRILCSTLTFIASVSPAIRMGAIPVFVDCEEDSWNMCPDLLDEAIRSEIKKGTRPKVVCVTHVYGQPANMTKIQTVCRQYGIALVEDAAEAAGAACDGRSVGTYGDFSVFSFNGNKTFTTGGGGMLCSANDSALKRARHLAFQARREGDWDYIHDECGYNFRLSNVLSALGRGQISRWGEILKRKKQIHLQYLKWANKRDNMSILDTPKEFNARSSFWINVLRLDPQLGIDRYKVRDFLAAKSIQTRPVWLPLHRQPMFRSASAYLNGISERLHAESICLPSGLTVTSSDISTITHLLDELIAKPKLGVSTKRRKGIHSRRRPR